MDTNRSCVATCPNFHFINATLTLDVYQCVAKCPNNTFVKIDTGKNYCVKAKDCPTGQYGNPIDGTCVDTCPLVGSVQLYADTNANVKMCVYVCPSGYYMETVAGKPTCVTSC